jgi:hypothetical protein
LKTLEFFIQFENLLGVLFIGKTFLYFEALDKNQKIQKKNFKIEISEIEKMKQKKKLNRTYLVFHLKSGTEIKFKLKNNLSQVLHKLNELLN